MLSLVQSRKQLMSFLDPMKLAVFELPLGAIKHELVKDTLELDLTLLEFFPGAPLNKIDHFLSTSPSMRISPFSSSPRCARC